MKRLGLGLPLAAGLLVGLAGQAAFAEDGEIKVGVVAAEFGVVRFRGKHDRRRGKAGDPADQRRRRHQGRRQDL